MFRFHSVLSCTFGTFCTFPCFDRVESSGCGFQVAVSHFSSYVLTQLFVLSSPKLRRMCLRLSAFNSSREPLKRDPKFRTARFSRLYGVTSSKTVTFIVTSAIALNFTYKRSSIRQNFGMVTT